MTRTRALTILLIAATFIGAAPQSSDLKVQGDRWWAHIAYLADDKLQGRNIGTPGFAAALDYVEGQFKTIGLAPAGTDGYRQPVALESRSLVDADSKLAIVRDGKEQPLEIGKDASLNARGELNGSLDAPMVFVGYGLSIPEAGWDDFKGLDLQGKIAVYVNAFPPVTVSDNVKSHVNTADQRWLALKAAGAIGVATIAGPRPAGATRGRGQAPAGRGENAAPGAGRGRAGGPFPPRPVVQLAEAALRASSGEAVAITLTSSGAAAVLAGSGHTLDEIDRLAADQKPLPRFNLPGTLQAHATLTVEPISSANVVGMVEGSDPQLKSEYVIMSAHLDHLGVGRPINGDDIYNGAMDDASGIASLIETARLLKASGQKTRRSVIFLAVTAEEKGELGSQYFAAHPTVPFKQIVADLNLDMFMPLYPLKVIEVQGLAESSLGGSVREAAQSLGVDVQTDREPSENRFIRSDQYSFIRRGIPSLAFKFGYQYGSPEETIRKNWVRDVYHKPNDDTKQPVDRQAAALFDEVIMKLLQSVANDPARPTWNADSFFKRFASGDAQLQAQAPGGQPQALTVQQLTPDVYWASGGGGNSGIVIGTTGVIVIDAKTTPEAGKALLAEIAKITPKPVTDVILTHSDGDHVNGLAAFPAGVHVIAQEGCKNEMEAALAAGGRGAPPADHMPTKVITRSSEALTLDGVPFELHHWAPAHTSGDLVVLLPQQKIVFTGDIITTNRPDALIHLEKHGSSAGWITTVQGILTLDANRFVPGHGDLQTKADIESRLSSVSKKRERIAALVKEGKSLDEIRAAVGDPAPAAGGRGGGFASFTEVVYRELTSVR